MCAQKKQSSNENVMPTMSVFTAKNLDGSLSKKEVNPRGFSVWVRVLLQNWRQGTLGVKGRSEVSFSNKKPWKQKGTGRARAGSARSPLWRGGGVIFGPQPRTRTLKISKKLKKDVLNSLFWKYLESDNINIVPWKLNGDKPSTRQAYEMLKHNNLLQEKVTLFLPMDDVVTYSSLINIPTVQVLFFDEMNAFDLITGKRWLVLDRDVEKFKEMVTKWD